MADDIRLRDFARPSDANALLPRLLTLTFHPLCTTGKQGTKTTTPAGRRHAPLPSNVALVMLFVVKCLPRPMKLHEGVVRLLPARSMQADQERGGPSIFPTATHATSYLSTRSQHVHIHHLPLSRRDGAAVRCTKACCLITAISSCFNLGQAHPSTRAPHTQRLIMPQPTHNSQDTEPKRAQKAAGQRAAAGSSSSSTKHCAKSSTRTLPSFFYYGVRSTHRQGGGHGGRWLLGSISLPDAATTEAIERPGLGEHCYS